MPKRKKLCNKCGSEFAKISTTTVRCADCGGIVSTTAVTDALERAIAKNKKPKKKKSNKK